MKNKLTVLLGKSCLSIGELRSLSEGDIVATQWRNNDPVYLRWNGQITATGHVVVWGDNVAFRIRKLATGSEINVPVFRKTRILDVLEVDLCLATQDADAEVLDHIDEHSFIIFDKNIDEAGELQLNGDTIASGKICIICGSYNRGAIEIQHTSIPQSLLADRGTFQSTGNAFKREKQFGKIYDLDFRHPDNMSRTSVSNMLRLNMMFAENLLHHAGKSKVEASVTRVDQVTFGDYIKTLRTRTVALMGIRPGKWNLYKNPIIELPSTVTNMESVDSPDFRKMIQEAEKRNFSLPIFIGYEEQTELVEKDTLELALKGAWEYVAHVEPEVIEIDCPVERYRNVIAASEMVCIVEIKVDGRENSLIAVYPFVSIEDLLPKLETAF